jgi:pentatricopeptide repeat protein
MCVDALARAGRLDDARLAFEKMLTYANHVGLFSEKIALTGEQIGKFPAGLHAPGVHRRRDHSRRGARPDRRRMTGEGGVRRGSVRLSAATSAAPQRRARVRAGQAAVGGASASLSP